MENWGKICIVCVFGLCVGRKIGFVFRLRRVGIFKSGSEIGFVLHK